jgi:hypothetical protein
MDAAAVLARLCEVIDAHAWDELGPLLADDFTCRLVHTGETFDKPSWIRLNAEYPGFQGMVVEDLVGAGDRAVSRCQVTGESEGRVQHFEVATFVRAADGRIHEMTEVWADVDQAPPPGTRPVRLG